MTDEEQRARELKGCPFCACLASVQCHGSIFEGAPGYRIECEGKCHAMTCYWHTRDQAIAAWNTRPALTDETWRGMEAGHGTIMLEIAAADDACQMWERRWEALQRMYAIDRCFADRDGKWGLRDFLDYAGEVCGFTRLPLPSPPVSGEGV